ncbi:DUF7507 domain-containing protein, partial [Pararhodonellum marinum]
MNLFSLLPSHGIFKHLVVLILAFQVFFPVFGSELSSLETPLDEKNSSVHSINLFPLPSDFDPSLTISLEVDQTVISGQVLLNYTILVTNTGDRPLTQPEVTCILPDGTNGVVTGTTGAITVGTSRTYLTSYQVKAEDIFDGNILVSTASIVTNPVPGPSTAVAETLVLVNPGLTVVKEVDQDEIAAPELLAYTITITNTGAVDLTDLTVTDLLPDGTLAELTGSLEDIPVGQSRVLTTSFQVSQKYINLGVPLVNTVEVVTNEIPEPTSATAETTILQIPQLSVVKSVDPESIDAPGLLQYTITIQNEGNVALTGLEVSDVLPDGSTATLTGSLADIPVGESRELTTTYPVTQADIDAGATLVNSVSVTTIEVPGPTEDTAETAIEQNAGLTVSKTVNTASITEPTLLEYTITIENTGNVALTGLQVIDILPDGNTATLTGSLADIPVGDNRELTTTYQVTEADIELGTTLVNSVSVTTTEVPGPTEDTAETAIEQNAGLTVSKTVNPTSISEPTLLAYTITIENSGNVALSGLEVIDILPDGITAILTGSLADIPVGETRELTTTYQSTQADIDAGIALVNNVSVTTAEVSGPTEDTAETAITQNAGLTVSKTVNPTSISEPTLLQYTITIENTGNVTLTGLQVTDILPDGSMATLTGSLADIPVGEIRELTTTYQATQADINAGNALVSSVSVTAAEVPGPTEDTAETAITQNAGLTVSKTVNQTNISEPTLLQYTITIENTGNVTLTGLQVTDILPDDNTATLTGSLANIPVGGSRQLTTSFQATQADIDTGNTLINSVSVTTNEVPGPTEDTAETIISQNVGMTVTKTVNPTNISAPTLLNYTITITNTGNITLTGLQVVDILPNGSELTLSGSLADIPVGASRIVTTTYQATQAEVDAGITLVNTVNVSSNEIPISVSDIAETTINQTPGLNVTKTVNQTSIDEPTLLSYTITITNTGNVALTGLQVSDILPNGEEAVLNGSLADIPVGQSRVLTTIYQATQEDISLGNTLINSVDVSTNEVSGPTSDSAETLIAVLPGLSVTNVVDQQTVLEPVELNYTITVNNTGNVVLTGIEVSGILPDGEPADIQGNFGAIPIQQNRVYTTKYQVNQEDIDLGIPLETEVRVSTNEIPEPVVSFAISSVSQVGELTVSKVVDLTEIDAPNNLNYTITVENTGNISLTGLQVTDILPDGSTATLTGSLADIPVGGSRELTT